MKVLLKNNSASLKSEQISKSLLPQAVGFFYCPILVFATKTYLSFTYYNYGKQIPAACCAMLIKPGG